MAKARPVTTRLIKNARLIAGPFNGGGNFQATIRQTTSVRTIAITVIMPVLLRRLPMPIKLKCGLEICHARITTKSPSGDHALNVTDSPKIASLIGRQLRSSQKYTGICSAPVVRHKQWPIVDKASASSCDLKRILRPKRNNTRDRKMPLCISKLAGTNSAQAMADLYSIVRCDGGLGGQPDAAPSDESQLRSSIG